MNLANFRQQTTKFEHQAVLLFLSLFTLFLHLYLKNKTNGIEEYPSNKIIILKCVHTFRIEIFQLIIIIISLKEKQMCTDIAN